MGKPLTIQQFAEKTGRGERQIRRMLNAGRIPGAKMICTQRCGWQWFIPPDAEWPDDKRCKAKAP